MTAAGLPPGYDAWKTTPPEGRECCACCGDALDPEDGRPLLYEGEPCCTSACEATLLLRDEAQPIARRAEAAVEATGGNRWEEMPLRLRRADGYEATGPLVDWRGPTEAGEPYLGVEDADGFTRTFPVAEIAEMEVMGEA